MANILEARVQETSTTTGTGNFTLGGATAGYRAFVQVMAINDGTSYTILSSDGLEWECGQGILIAPTTLQRFAVSASSNANALVNFSAGTKYVFQSPLGSDILEHSASQITSGTLALARGGTGADLSATGGAGQVVKQTSLGAALTVGTVNTVAVVTKIANYTLTANDCVVLADASAGNLTLTLPAANTVSGIQYNLKKIDATGAVVTIEANAAETIDGELQQAISNQYTSMTIVSDGTNWHII